MARFSSSQGSSQPQDLKPQDTLTVEGATPKITIGDAGAEDTMLVFDGNAQDFYISIDDTTDDLTIGTGLVAGTNVRMVVENGGNVGIGTIAPDAKLDVAGNTHLGGELEINSATANAKGSGFSDHVTAGNMHDMYVSNINGEIVTTILVDIHGLQNGGSLNDIIGDEGEDNAYLTRLTPSVNGYPYRVEMNCVEPPHVTGDASGGNQYSLAFNTAALAEDAAYTGGSNALLVIDGTENAWSDGMSLTNEGDVDLGMGGNYDSGGGAYMYIVAGSGVSGGNVAVTSGKFVIKVYAANF
jgi:hypothetical protein